MAEQQEEKKPPPKRFNVQVLPGTMVENIDFPSDVKDEDKPAGSVRVSPGTLVLTEPELGWLRAKRPDLARSLVVGTELPQAANPAPVAKAEAAPTGEGAGSGQEDTPKAPAEDKKAKPKG